MGIGDRIKLAAARVGGQTKLSKTIGIGQRTLVGYVSETSSPQLSTLNDIANATGVDLGWLVTGNGGSSDDGDLKLKGSPDVSTITLPRYDIQASAGHGALADSQAIADYLTVSRDWLARYVPAGTHVVVIEAKGDSMEPTVRHGDLLLVEMSIDTDTVAAGGVFILTVAGMIMIKRLQIMLNGDLKISSDNKAYDAETIPAKERDERVTIHGRVFWCGGPLGGRG